MKRSSRSLVEYASSEDDSPSETEPVSKKRKTLPALSTSIAGITHQDNPALHQGRLRSSPHVDGQFSAHVYLSVSLSRKSPLHTLIQDVLRDAKAVVPTLQDLVSLDANASELHVSLSRPVFLRAHQREEFKRSVRDAAKQSAPFDISFAAFSELTNDEKTRTFLTLEIGAGHHELKGLSDGLRPTIEGFRQKAYYETPRFHASIGWALLDRAMDRSTGVEDPEFQEFPTIPGLPESLFTMLERKYHISLTSTTTGACHVRKVFIKIGRDISSWTLTQ
ncbi:U6 snRNA phosphodiesterase Usb1 [Coprinopsis sp. MPI-PUGE-AT-0042]|nr:U6 snRNA phosphodiesterase Usb1 [Coprinopsis sp. MPI-PUGE-AT-0042]